MLQHALFQKNVGKFNDAFHAFVPMDFFRDGKKFGDFANGPATIEQRQCFKNIGRYAQETASRLKRDAHGDKRKIFLGKLLQCLPINGFRIRGNKGPEIVLGVKVYDTRPWSQ